MSRYGVGKKQAIADMKKADMKRQWFNGTCYRLRGDSPRKPTVVLIHGVGLNQDMWRYWSNTLLEDYCVLTYDFLGHGGSENPVGERSIADYVEQLTALTEFLGMDRFALAGFSMGALISQAFASCYAEKLSHLILLHSVYQRTAEQCKGVQERYRITRDQGPMATVEMAIERWFSERYRNQHPGKMDEIRKIFADHKDDGYLKAYGVFAFGEEDMGNYPVNRVTCPAIAITGSADVGSLPEMSRALARDLPLGSGPSSLIRGTVTERLMSLQKSCRNNYDCS